MCSGQVLINFLIPDTSCALFVRADPSGLPATARQLVEKLSMPADFSYTTDVQSPALQQYYSVLQALALNQAEPEWQTEKDDNMRPDPALFEGDNAAVLHKFKDLTGVGDVTQHTTAKVCADFVLLLPAPLDLYLTAS